MGETVEKLARFTRKTVFKDLPDEVVHEIKRVVLDTVGCGLGGHSTERGKIVSELAERFGGVKESSVIGTRNKVSCTNAAFANGELMNALDFDAIAPVNVHSAPSLVAAALSIGESGGISGEDLILSTALGFEISATLGTGAVGVIPVTEGSEKGSLRWPAVSGCSVVTLGTAALAGKILGLGQEQMAQAIGISGCICPPNLGERFRHVAPFRMTKYGPPGWVAQTGLTAALLAEKGYTGDTEILDTENGFWKYTGVEENREGVVLSDLGKKWQYHKVWYKQYPCGG